MAAAAHVHCGLVVSPLGRCLVVSMPDGSALLSGRVQLRLAPLCKLLASMLQGMGCARGERRVGIAGVCAVVQPREHFFVALVCEASDELRGASLTATILADGLEGAHGPELRQMHRALKGQLDAALASYTAASALNGAHDEANEAPRTLAAFAGFEERVMRPLLAAPPFEELWLGPLLARQDVLGVHLLAPAAPAAAEDGRGEPAEGSDSHAPMLSLAARDGRARLAALTGPTHRDAWAALVTHGRASAELPLHPIAMPGLAGTGPHPPTDVARLRAITCAAPFGRRGDGLLVVYYALPANDIRALPAPARMPRLQPHPPPPRAADAGDGSPPRPMRASSGRLRMFSLRARRTSLPAHSLERVPKPPPGLPPEGVARINAPANGRVASAAADAAASSRADLARPMPGELVPAHVLDAAAVLIGRRLSAAFPAAPHGDVEQLAGALQHTLHHRHRPLLLDSHS